MRTQKIPLKPRLNQTLVKTRNFIKEAHIKWLPVNPNYYYERYLIALYSCKEAELIYGIPDPFKVKAKGVDAKTYRNRDTGFYMTVYDEEALPERIRWTLAHELGHIVLGHLEEYELTSINRSGLKSCEYETLEKEANLFAAELLSPLGVLKAIGANSHNQIMNICNISRQAAQNRAKTLYAYRRIKTSTYTEVFYKKQFKEFIAMISVSSDSYRREIMNIKHSFVDTDDRNRFVKCPRCGNAAISEEANFCKICGLYLFNTCGEVPNFQHYDNDEFIEYCTTISDGDTRFCEYCGVETYLSKLGLLTPWNEIGKAYEEIAASLAIEEDQLKVADKKKR